MTKLKLRWIHYLRSSHWRNLRIQAFERDGYKCGRCGSRAKLRGHHKRYRSDLTLCTVDDVETLCEACHAKHHKQKRKARKLERRPRRKRDHLVDIICRFGAQGSDSIRSAHLL
jgi:5-methylcytosine-specific restriction endonuclease McrA